MGNAAIEREIRAAEAALYRAMIAKDYRALEEILAPDLVYVHSTAVSETKKEYLAGVAKGLYDYESISSRGLTFHVHDGCVAMSGAVDMLVGETGRPRDMIHLLFVLIWAKQAGAWRLQFRQATRIMPR